MFAILQGRNLSTLIIGFLGLLKIVLDSNNIHLFTDAQINEFANGVCSVVALIALWATHLKQSVKPPTLPNPLTGTQTSTITLPVTLPVTPPVTPQPTTVPAPTPVVNTPAETAQTTQQPAG